ncbi:MAG TPA: hypothetical protein VFE95_05720 [Pseudomonas sp.]|nr:hypothetical protein [Pseudomonas sp.]
MAWTIPAVLIALAVGFWALSHRATDELVAWCRFLLACFLLLLALIYAVALTVRWMMS